MGKKFFEKRRRRKRIEHREKMRAGLKVLLELKWAPSVLVKATGAEGMSKDEEEKLRGKLLEFIGEELKGLRVLRQLDKEQKVKMSEWIKIVSAQKAILSNRKGVDWMKYKDYVNDEDILQREYFEEVKEESG